MDGESHFRLRLASGVVKRPLPVRTSPPGTPAGACGAGPSPNPSSRPARTVHRSPPESPGRSRAPPVARSPGPAVSPPTVRRPGPAAPGPAGRTRRRDAPAARVRRGWVHGVPPPRGVLGVSMHTCGRWGALGYVSTASTASMAQTTAAWAGGGIPHGCGDRGVSTLLGAWCGPTPD